MVLIQLFFFFNNFYFNLQCAGRSFSRTSTSIFAFCRCSSASSSSPRARSCIGGMVIICQIQLKVVYVCVLAKGTRLSSSLSGRIICPLCSSTVCVSFSFIFFPPLISKHAGPASNAELLDSLNFHLFSVKSLFKGQIFTVCIVRLSVQGDMAGLTFPSTSILLRHSCIQKSF